ncbi:SpoIID/LytB domain-containing protein [Leptospira sp. GIMC2001]|uniref:SpoIID/LytB domain-containing protein n=1 Tax=Leptospira sp. GIMC2001 TaxID=1513297 RepID=UPI00234AB9AB|nr:SpoIID/LytB domain-containing protein [Leptospira sp. GIMC2001]WCL48834.1 SpoIID/LytB domain-containing protein [Leptospira sp. GIMC2001]
MRSYSLFFNLILLLILGNCAGFVTETWKPPKEFDSSNSVRVFLGKAGDETRITSEGMIQVYDVNDLLIKKSIDILQINPRSLKAKIRIKPESGTFTYKNISYRGEIWIDPNDGDAYVLNIVPLEKYLLAVVPSEMPNSWPEEALKAQAVCARTFVIREMLNKKNQPYDVDTSTSSQVYGGVGKEHPRTTKAVEDTQGTILIYKDEPIHAFFHSNAGGYTERPENVWGGKNLPYLDHVESEYDQYASNYSWQLDVPIDSMNRSLASIGLGRIESINVLGRNLSQRVELLEVIGEKGSRKVKGVDFRKMLGYDKVKSLKFGIKKESDRFFIKGLGFGHGVGLSQWGAHGMAKDNINYRNILRHYYKGADLANMVE